MRAGLGKSAGFLKPSLRLFFHGGLERLCYWGAMSELVLTDEFDASPAEARRDRWLGIAACLAIVWYILGFFAFIITVKISGAGAQALYSPEQIAYLLAMPFWVSMANVVVLGAGLIGSVYLLLRRKSAYMWYMVSLFAILVNMLDATLRGGFAIMDPTHFGISLSVIIVGIYLFWVAYDARDNNQIS